MEFAEYLPFWDKLTEGQCLGFDGRTLSKAEAVAAEICAMGGEAIAVSVDVTNAESVKAGEQAHYDCRNNCSEGHGGLLVDKEEIGSVGATGMHSRFFENTVAEETTVVEEVVETPVEESAPVVEETPVVEEVEETPVEEPTPIVEETPAVEEVEVPVVEEVVTDEGIVKQILKISERGENI